jgi:hypothetical protein
MCMKTVAGGKVGRTWGSINLSRITNGTPSRATMATMILIDARQINPGVSVNEEPDSCDHRQGASGHAARRPRSE